ncbi:MAG: enoyl-CoA hydratase/isomerase family protein [Nannocystis sp.]|uniref:3-hydroxyacyl-CoA dehydrogenase NAD-binding domain-containing protein n=1 Tax=Nannocystis sp. TaxID=1962667 RepID=UPI002423892B|nr:3-hydroxyacyl-CoA dehydrogenase NAD-binding domain-containing protein [Nannocystis sp.]MBK9757768.1 enoyl-CoA hydratase/isomerase family protein [Nannocystis sp.]
MFTLTLDPPEVSPRLAVITIDRAGEKVNTITPEALAEVEQQFASIEATPGLAGIILISGKRDNFIAGADVEVFAHAKDRREIEGFGRRGHEVLARIAGARVPIVAAIHGACLGAGLELALACTYRVCSDSPKTVLALPEVMLGLFPGGGGVTRLPRLVGLREALDMILTGRNIRPRAARRMGLVDQVVAEEALLPAARAAAGKLAAGKLQPHLQPRGDVVRTLLEKNPLGRSLVFRQARKTVERKTFGLYPAPLVALDIIEKGLGLPLEEALKLEPPAFAELAVGETSRSLVSLFRRSNALKKQPVLDAAGARVEGAEVRRLGMVGGGFMGADIAVVSAEKGIETRIRDIAADPLAKALAHCKAHFDRRARSVGERHVFKARSRVSGGLDLTGFNTMDLIIEAVPEALGLKQDVFAQLEAMVPRTTILASNTSALPIGAIAERLVHKDRVIGLHFFSPVSKMPLLEIVKTPHTSPQTLATCLRYAAQIGKTPIVVNDGPGFYTTRVLGFYLMAALEMVQAGHSIEAVDRGARMVGWPVGPITLLDEVGIDVGAKVSKTLAAAFPERIHVPDTVDQFLAEKRFGRKTGRGFYVYPPEQRGLLARRERKHIDPAVYGYFAGRQAIAEESHPEELGERLTLIAALEAVRCLEAGIVQSSRDGDIGAVFGFGYPPMRGGPFRHLDAMGPGAVLTRLAVLRERHGATYNAPELLVRLAREGKNFTSFDIGQGDHA